VGDEDERAGPAVLHRGQDAGRADPAGHVHVVAAGVHDADLDVVLVARPHLAGVRHPGVLRHRKPVHIRPDENRRAGPVLEDADEAVAADLLGDLEAEGLHLLGEPAGGAFLLVRKFWLGMELLVQGVQGGQVGIDLFLDRLGGGFQGGTGERRRQGFRLVRPGGEGAENPPRRWLRPMHDPVLRCASV
jgi:hypothetical protein